MSDPTQKVTQTVIGDRNIFSGTGDVIVVNHPRPVHPTEARERRHLHTLLAKVKTFWIEGVLERSLHNAVLLDLDKRLEPEAVDHPWGMVLELPDQTNQTLPPKTDIIDIFEQRNGTLLILGEPGSGKTITLLELARDLIGCVEEDESLSQPIPVVFNLSTWSDKQDPIIDWLVAELSAKYQIPKKIGRSWVEENRIIPLLDGLDEVKPSNRADCVVAINEFVETYGIPGLAVCSRLEEYTRLSVRLRFNGAICLLPLTNKQVDDYLARAGPVLDQLRTALRADKTLQSLAQSPLMLNVMSLAYQDVPKGELANQALVTPEERRRRLFTTYIERMFRRKGKTVLPYTPEQTKGWLTWLAKRMKQHSQTIFLIEQLQPSWLATHRQRWAYALGSRLIGGLSIGLILALLFAREGLLRFGEFGLVLGLIGGLSVGIIDALRFQRSGSNMELDEDFSLLRATRNVFSIMLIVGLSAWQFIWPISKSFNGVALTQGLIVGLIFGLIFGIRGSRRSTKHDIQTVETLSPSLGGALRGAASGLIAGMVIGMIAAFFLWLAILKQEGPTPAFRPIEALATGLFFGVIFGLIGMALGGLDRGVRETKGNPNQGISLSARNSLLIGLIAGLTVGLSVIAIIFFLISSFRPSELLLAGLVFGLSAGLIVALWHGGLDVIQHYILRVILSQGRHTPRIYSRFLDCATDQILMQKVGGGYIFIHRLLLEHFAELES